MKSAFPALLASLMLGAFQLPAHAADPHQHGHAAAEATRLQLNGGKKWATDAPLRQSMNGINQAMGEALPLIHRDQLTEDRYRALAATIKQKVAYVVENCKLDAKADAMLHLVIADLLAGAEIMEGKGTLPRHDGAVKVLAALKAYGRHFQHPGWRLAQG